MQDHNWWCATITYHVYLQLNMVIGYWVNIFSNLFFLHVLFSFLQFHLLTWMCIFFWSWWQCFYFLDIESKLRRIEEDPEGSGTLHLYNCIQGVSKQANRAFQSLFERQVSVVSNWARDFEVLNSWLEMDYIKLFLLGTSWKDQISPRNATKVQNAF